MSKFTLRSEKGFHNILKTLFLPVLFMFFWQNASIAQSPVIMPPGFNESTIDGTPWKSISDFSEVIASERLVANHKINAPGLPLPQVALYRGYDRMLSYVQADIAASLPLDGIVQNNFQRVLQETPNDPLLSSMDSIELSILRDRLIGELLKQ